MRVDVIIIDEKINFTSIKMNKKKTDESSWLNEQIKGFACGGDGGPGRHV